MKLMTWNIQCGGVLDLTKPDKKNINDIIETIQDECSDVLVIQEYQTEYREQLVKNGLEKIGYKFFAVCKDCPDRTQRNRVLIASKHQLTKLDINPKIDNYDRRNWNEVEVTIKPNKRMIRILGVHVPLAQTKDKTGRIINRRLKKKKYLDQLLEKFKEYKDSPFPAVILGDFNLYKFAEFPEYLDYFSKELEELTAEDVPTWGSNKLDYIFANTKFLEMMKVESGNIEPKNTAYSDHKYFCVELDLERCNY